MSKAKVYLSGKAKSSKALLLLVQTLKESGSKYLEITEDKNEANMQVDISEIDKKTDILEESKFIINSAIDVNRYERKRKMIIIKEAKKLLFSTSKNVN